MLIVILLMMGGIFSAAYVMLVDILLMMGDDSSVGWFMLVYFL